MAKAMKKAAAPAMKKAMRRAMKAMKKPSAMKGKGGEGMGRDKLPKDMIWVYRHPLPGVWLKARLGAPGEAFTL
jgi:hypothetical protein